MTQTSLPRLLLLHAAALAFTFGHTFVDFHIGLFGETSSSLTALQAANIFLQGLVLAGWSVSLALAASGSRRGLSGAFSFAVGWALLYNGAMAIAAAPPPSAGFPYQDITHFGSLIFGGLAAYAAWREMRARQVSLEGRSIFAAVGLIVAAVGIGGVLALMNIMGG